MSPAARNVAGLGLAGAVVATAFLPFTGCLVTFTAAGSASAISMPNMSARSFAAMVFVPVDFVVETAACPAPSINSR